MISPATIKEIISQQTSELFAGSLRSLNEAIIGEPVTMKDDKEIQRYWFTPFIIKNKIAGFCIQNVDGKIILHGLVTPNAAWEDKIDAAFLSAPPEKIIAEIKQSYPGYTVSALFFSFDQIPQKWAWQVQIENKEEKKLILYASHNGWYEKRLHDNGMEG